MERGISQNSDKNNNIGGLWVGVFALLAVLFLPAQPVHASDGSYTVTETIETIEYAILEPAFSSKPPLWEVLGRFEWLRHMLQK